MDLRLKGKVALVTGAGRGVGRGICLRLAEEGARIIVNDFHEDRAARVAEEVLANGGHARAVRADITDMGQVRAMVAQAVELYARRDPRYAELVGPLWTIHGLELWLQAAMGEPSPCP